MIQKELGKRDGTLIGALMIAAIICLALFMSPIFNAQPSNTEYVRGAYEATRYRQLTGHEPSYAWMVISAEYRRPSGQNDSDWILATEAQAAAWELGHVKDK